MRVYPRHRLDIRPWHIAYAVGACALPNDAAQLTRRIERYAGRDDAIVCLSVRSGFELLLESLALPSGSEVLVSAITHPGMVRILERHGLRPVAVDLDEVSLVPVPEAVERGLTPRTRAVLVAHLFGSRVDLDHLVHVARRERLLLIEDCAQSLLGPDDSGDTRADVAMFSFGSIKTSPGLGGAIVYVRDRNTLARMRSLQGSWPRQSRFEYLKRALWFGGLLGLGVPSVFGLFCRIGALLHIDLERLVNACVHAVRPPSADDDARFSAWLRRRPSVPLLAVLAKRLTTFDRTRLERRRQAGEKVARALPAGLPQPGRGAVTRTHWVFPVLADSGGELITTLRAAGFDATRSTTSITAVSAPAGSPQPETARSLMSKAVFLPVYPELPEAARRRLIAILRAYDRDASRRRPS